MRSTALVPCLLAAALALAACGVAHPNAVQHPATGLAVRASSYAHVLAPKDVPAALVTAALGPAQAAADEASKRRGIDYFALPNDPVGLEIGSGDGAGHVLSFVGTSKTDVDLNIELRALVAGSHVGVTMNYSGQTTQSRARLAVPAPSVPSVRDAESTSFELITGVPGNGVADEYSDYIDHLAENLAERFQARPFSFDDTPIVFAIHQGDAVTGFVLTNQGNQMVLGEQKYADVQNVACYTAKAELAAAYTIIGFNRKTKAAGAAPVWHLEHDARFGTFARCGSF